MKYKIFELDTFSINYFSYLRKEVNYLALRVDHLLLAQNMSLSNEIFNFNPTQVFKFNHDVSLNVNNIKLTVLRALNFKNYVPDNSDITTITKNDNKLQEENGILNYFMKIPVNEIMVSVYDSDIDNCYWSGDFKFKEKSYFRPLVFFKT
jgi:hypothetical protein